MPRSNTGPHPFSQVDVFPSEAYRGNPVAVVHDADDLTEEAMATFARWTNLSETTFLLKPTHANADYRLRIFTPGGELPFAGHPTLGSCHAWLEAGGSPQVESTIVQECAAGLITIKQIPAGTQKRLAFAAPPLLNTGPVEEAILAQICTTLNIPRQSVTAHQWVDNGPGWCAVMLQSAEQVLTVKPDFSALGDIKLGVVGPQPEGSETDFEVRAFVPGLGVPEDPVTGSLNAGIAQWLIGSGLAPAKYMASQGACLQRAGKLFIEKIGDDIWVAGDTTTRIAGTVQFGL